jgi:hypothetical protein
MGFHYLLCFSLTVRWPKSIQPRPGELGIYGGAGYCKRTYFMTNQPWILFLRFGLTARFLQGLVWGYVKGHFGIRGEWLKMMRFVVFFLVFFTGTKIVSWKNHKRFVMVALILHVEKNTLLKLLLTRFSPSLVASSVSPGEHWMWRNTHIFTMNVEAEPFPEAWPFVTCRICKVWIATKGPWASHKARRAWSVCNQWVFSRCWINKRTMVLLGFVDSKHG